MAVLSSSDLSPTLTPSPPFEDEANMTIEQQLWAILDPERPVKEFKVDSERDLLW